MFYGMYNNNDPYNTLGLRNVRNAIKREYNCAGYALGCFSWYCPDDGTRYCYFDEYNNESMHEQTMHFVKNILQDFPSLRLIDSIEQAQKSDEVIAFRLSTKITDFHFMVRKHGRWYHKQGGKPAIDTVTEQIALRESWFNDYGNEYDGEIILMVKTF